MSKSLSCFPDSLLPNALDKSAFKFQHKLLGHPSMEMANLAKVIPSLDEGQLFHSSGKLSTNANFARTYLDNKNGLSIEETIHTMKDNDSFIMVRNPESHDSFKPLFKELCGDMEAWMKAHQLGHRAIDPMFYMFIASPNSVTPFHIDRISTVLMQFQGSKTVTTFPAWDRQTVPQEVLETFMIDNGRGPSYDPSFEAKGTAHEFGPGEALHIPFIAPHHVKNGSSEVSISLSITFHTAHSEKLKQAMLLNYLMRKRLNYRPSSVGRSEIKDRAKARILRGYTKAKAALTA